MAAIFTKRSSDTTPNCRKVPRVLPQHQPIRREEIAPNLELDLNAFIVAVDELPAFGIGTTIISITLNDQIVWQNYVQARQDVIETYAVGAAELVNQYVLNYQEVQQGLVNEDQSGTGIF